MGCAYLIVGSSLRLHVFMDATGHTGRISKERIAQKVKPLIAIYFVGAAFLAATHGVLEELALLGGALMTIGLIRKWVRAKWRWFELRWRRVETYMAEQRKVRDVVLGTPDRPGVGERLRQIADRLGRGDERFDELDGKVDEIRHELNGHEGGIKDRLTQIETHIGLIAKTDELRIKDAAARGDKRTPIDRRTDPPA